MTVFVLLDVRVCVDVDVILDVEICVTVGVLLASGSGGGRLPD